MRGGLHVLGLFLVVLLYLALLPFASASSMWSKTYGDAVESEEAYAVVATADRGFVVAGSINHITFGIEKNQWDAYLVKTDIAGNQLWNRTFGGNASATPNMYYMEVTQALVATADGGFALAGYQGLFPQATGTPQGSDFWLLKTDAQGNPIWNHTYGNPGNSYMESATSMITTTDGGYLLVGSVKPWPLGNSDIWMVKTDGYGNMQWNKTFGTARSERAPSVCIGVDGYVLVCTANSTSYVNDCALLIKTDFNGNMQWNKTFDGSIARQPQKVIGTLDGGYAFCGTYGTSQNSSV